MPEPDAQEAIGREVSERMRLEMGNLLQQIIILQVQNDHLKREVERLTALVPATPSNNHPERVSR